jgi:hypothetical protein
MLVDPDGRDLVIWYKVNGELKSLVFKGNNANKTLKSSYVQAVLKAYKYNVDNGGGSASTTVNNTKTKEYE